MVEDGQAEYLRVNADPAAVAVVPVLGDPVVEALARLEVRGETAPSPRRQPAVAKQRAAQHREMPARADDSPGRAARQVQRGAIERHQDLDEPRGWADVLLGEAVRPHAERRRVARLEDQAVHVRANADGIGGDPGKPRERGRAEPASSVIGPAASVIEIGWHARDASGGH